MPLADVLDVLGEGGLERRRRGRRRRGGGGGEHWSGGGGGVPSNLGYGGVGADPVLVHQVNQLAFLKEEIEGEYFEENIFIKNFSKKWGN